MKNKMKCVSLVLTGVIGGIASGCGTGIAKATTLHPTNLHAYAWLRKK